MGISSGKQTNKPVYNKQIEGAGSALTSAYNTAAPQIQQLTDTVTGLAPDIAARYREGDAGVNASRDYNVKVLSGQYLDEGNPHLQAMIDDSGNDLRNQMQAALGVRGLTGGSSYADIISKNLGKNTLALRYQDYDNERTRMANSAGQAPGIAGAAELPMGSLLAASDAAQNPLRAAVGYTAGLGGLLGQYQTIKTKQPWGPMVAGGLANVAAAYAGGG
jgi:hypothetical protein